MLNVFRAVQGFGAAFVLTSGTAILANEFRSPPERAKAFGLLGSCFGIGLALGPLIGGAFSSGLGWRWIFLVNVPNGKSTFNISTAVAFVAAAAGVGSAKQVMMHCNRPLAKVRAGVL